MDAHDAGDNQSINSLTGTNWTCDQQYISSRETAYLHVEYPIHSNSILIIPFLRCTDIVQENNILSSHARFAVLVYLSDNADEMTGYGIRKQQLSKMN